MLPFSIIHCFSLLFIIHHLLLVVVKDNCSSNCFIIVVGLSWWLLIINWLVMLMCGSSVGCVNHCIKLYFQFQTLSSLFTIDDFYCCSSRNALNIIADDCRINQIRMFRNYFRRMWMTTRRNWRSDCDPVASKRPLLSWWKTSNIRDQDLPLIE